MTLRPCVLHPFDPLIFAMICRGCEDRAVTTPFGAWSKNPDFGAYRRPLPIPTLCKVCGARGFRPHLTPLVTPLFEDRTEPLAMADLLPLHRDGTRFDTSRTVGRRRENAELPLNRLRV